MTMTDFSHLHELEERAKRTQSQMLRVQKNDAEWNQLAIQLFQTEQEIADERTFLGLKDMDASKLYAELLDDHESEVAMQVIESTADRPLWEKHKEQERWKTRCEELEVVAAALYLHQDGCRDQFELYRSVYLVPDFSRKSITCPRCGIVRNEGEMRICCM